MSAMWMETDVLGSGLRPEFEPATVLPQEIIADIEAKHPGKRVVRFYRGQFGTYAFDDKGLTANPRLEEL